MQFQVLGFPVRVENGAYVLAGIYLLLGLQDRSPMIEVIGGILVIFGSILVHELGHAIAAKAHRLGPIDITLHGFGGFTRHRASHRALPELLVTVAGPSAGFLLGGVCLIAAMFVDGGVAGRLLDRLVWVNLFWSAFNLLPLLPMDGGYALLHGLRLISPTAALPVTGGISLIGGIALALGGAWLMASGFPSALFLLWLASTTVTQSWSLLGAWRNAR